MEKGKSWDYLEEMVVALKMEVKGLREKMMVLEERFGLLSKFTIKETHAIATTLHLSKDNQDEDLNQMDSKLLFGFLAED